jgi:hypothetical protein
MTSSASLENGSGPIHRLPWLSLVGGVATTALWVVHMVLRDHYAPGDPWRLFTTALLVGAFGLFVGGQVQVARALDEFQRQVQLVALSIAFPVSLVGAFAVSSFAAEGVLGSLDPRDLPLVMLLAYGFGLLLAWRRFR